jgi:hypothetical protein
MEIFEVRNGVERNDFLIRHRLNKNLLLNLRVFSPSFRHTKVFRWLSQVCCCCSRKKKQPKSQFSNGRQKGGPTRNLHHQNYDSMRTTTTSLTVATSRHSTCMRSNRVVIVEHQKSIVPELEEVSGMISICSYQ